MTHKQKWRLTTIRQVLSTGSSSGRRLPVAIRSDVIWRHLLIEWFIKWATSIMWLTAWVVEWLVSRPVEWLAGWLVEWLVDRLVECLVGWLVQWLVDRSVECLAGWLVQWLAGGAVERVAGWLVERVAAQLAVCKARQVAHHGVLAARLQYTKYSEI